MMSKNGDDPDKSCRTSKESVREPFVDLADTDLFPAVLRLK